MLVLFITIIFGDHAKTFAVGKIDNEKEKLLRVTEESL